jgi:hypothetical protein
MISNPTILLGAFLWSFVWFSSSRHRARSTNAFLDGVDLPHHFNHPDVMHAHRQRSQEKKKIEGVNAPEIQKLCDNI